MYRVGITTNKRNKNQWGILRDRLLRLNTPQQQSTTVTNAFVFTWPYAFAQVDTSSFLIKLDVQLFFFHSLYFRDCSVSFLMADGLFFSFQVCDAITIRFIFKGNLTGSARFLNIQLFRAVVAFNEEK